jgi:rare lipoprotein A
MPHTNELKIKGGEMTGIDMHRSALAVVLLAIGGYACAPGEDPQAETLSEEEIAALEEQYPRLGEEPLPPPEPNGEPVLEEVRGEATFYADKFEGRRTASGIPFRQNQLVAAHRDFPFGTVLRVTNTRNDRAVNVRVVDRGPFGAEQTIIDLSRRAAQQLGYIEAGRTPVQVEVLEWGDGVEASV